MMFPGPKTIPSELLKEQKCRGHRSLKEQGRDFDQIVRKGNNVSWLAIL
jgi:hypothetical protein